MKPSLFLSCVLMVAASGLASAQAPPAPATPPAQTAPTASARPSECAQTQPAPRGIVVPEGRTTGQRAEPLGDKLAKSDGVLCPPAGVDPEIRAPTPDTGDTSVVAPPGSPGGDPGIRPK
ncbi:MAG: hypothetical protein QOF22_884 [Bradyrhizobium sp.]|jgi:hypothetical protein|nr:hypothetical protein [Bradyrhizobium sp.]